MQNRKDLHRRQHLAASVCTLIGTERPISANHAGSWQRGSQGLQHRALASEFYRVQKPALDKERKKTGSKKASWENSLPLALSQSVPSSSFPVATLARSVGLNTGLTGKTERACRIDCSRSLHLDAAPPLLRKVHSFGAQSTSHGSDVAETAAPAQEEVAVDEILAFWFGASDLTKGPPPKKMTQRWFRKDLDFDKLCENKFGPLIERAARGEFASWEEEPASNLALVILLDQFSRNVYRDTPQAFAQDAQALRIAKRAIERGFDQKFGCLERSFFYMPFEHSEDLEDQDRACQLFVDLKSAAPADVAELCDGFHEFAVKHREVILRFGRFPHRNQILGRKSTSEELDFLKQPGSRF
ncbi:hypothetical protein KFL_000930120 [Klebsormidium nitens]|uniref:DUF924 domain-containing protein n=1 Tax=Klebsormidium nitens TaxID=105231 RepID=A0A1Y1HZC3_KLENI|nr:hypothetical protein KFL_000930120 [Klebsormidium nitens]|eukprot:GAQ81866.1 hypothetical protein KFL_000930120 [Klebsormidium nitens]